LLHRETDKEKVARNIDRVFDLHAASIAWMEEYTGIKYPYRKFDFALIPSFQYGGMEHVGAIQYRAASLLLDASPSDEKLLNRARLIAHETAHMWFGNLVTMQWFNDVWTKEVFANFMAAKIINPNFPKINHDLSFFVDHYPSAYAVDRSAGANPIRQALPNLSDAGQMYGAIIYHKAPIMMRQLELLLGEDALREGLREYLHNHAFANATWPDLIRILDTKTKEDLTSWSQVWVNSPGRPEFLLEEKTGEPSAILQRDSAGLARVWPQQFSVRIADQGKSKTLHVASSHTTTPLPGLQRNPNTELLFNADGLGYGNYPADFRNLKNWPQLNPVEKASSLVNHYENLLAGSLPDVGGYYLKLLDLIAVEKNQLLLSLLLSQLSRVHHSFLHEDQRHQEKLETVLWQTMLRQEESSTTKIFFDAFASLATSPDQLVKVRGIWSGDFVIDKLKLAENDYIELAEILAIRIPDDSEGIISEQLANTDNPDSHRRLAFIAPALSASSVTRDAFFDSLALVDNRNTESWVLDALARLHHPSRIQQSEKYILPSLELLQEIQRTGDIFFPAGWLAVTLRNHHSDEAVATVQSFLANSPDYNPQLRMKILQAVDLPIRSNAILAAP
jgi:aminopeptidase N